MDNNFIILAMIIPLLLSIFGIVLFNYYSKEKQKRLVIDTLIKSNYKIIDKDKVELSNKDDNKLTKKLKFAGFVNKGADVLFIIISIVFSSMLSLFIFFIAKSIIISFVSFLLFLFLPYLFLVKIIKTREEEFNFNLKELIDKVTSMMKSGVGFEQALKKSIATCKSKLTKDIFSIYINEKSIIGEDKCFEKMFDIIESRELRIFYLTISIGRKSGGKFSNTLETLRKTLNDQGEIKNEIMSSTKEIRIGTYLILGITVALFIMLNDALNNALYAHFFGSDTGKIQLFFISIWVGLGIFVNNMLTKIK